MGKVIVELVVNSVPGQEGHSRGKWELKVKDGMTPTMAIEKLKKCSKFKATYEIKKKTPHQKKQQLVHIQINSVRPSSLQFSNCSSRTSSGGARNLIESKIQALTCHWIVLSITGTSSTTSCW